MSDEPTCKKCGRPIYARFRFGSERAGWEHMEGECRTDEPTLTDRLRQKNDFKIVDAPDGERSIVMMTEAERREEAATRIAELEAEVVTLRADLNIYGPEAGDGMVDRIAELEVYEQFAKDRSVDFEWWKEHR